MLSLVHISSEAYGPLFLCCLSITIGWPREVTLKHLHMKDAKGALVSTDRKDVRSDRDSITLMNQEIETIATLL
jgi:hypothetical protein